MKDQCQPWLQELVLHKILQPSYLHAQLNMKVGILSPDRQQQDASEVRSTDVVTHTINIGDYQPIRQPLRMPLPC